MSGSKRYHVSDGTLVLTLRPTCNGWYAVTIPMEPEVATHARKVPEAFSKAYRMIDGLNSKRETLRQPILRK